MTKEFYYLDEKEQKGPFSIDQLKTVGLKPDTLVWTNEFDKWKPVKEVEELKELLKKTPPPPPIIDNLPNSTNQPLKEDKKILVTDSNFKFWTLFKIYGTAFLLICLATFIAFSISNNKKQQLKKEVYAKVDNILKGKTVVLDGVENLTQGKLKETGYPSKPKNFLDTFKWWQREKLYTIYEATNGGFKIKQLTREGDDFDIETTYSGDMGYKKPLGKYVKPEYMDDGLGGHFKIDGYYSNNYRLSVRECYTKAFEYFSKEDRYSPGAYTPGKYVDISHFSDIRNEYFYMNDFPSKGLGRDVLVGEIDGDHEANVNTEDWAVYYTRYIEHYGITENETAIRKDLFTYLGITVGSIILILLVLLFAKPKYFRNLNLFGKRWQNSSYQEQIFFFEHSFFGKHTFVEIINDKVSKGILKFTDKGNTINLSYPNKELFHKIEKISQDDLVLTSIKDKINIAFKRVGAKEKIVPNSEISVDKNPSVDKSEESI